MPTSQQNQDFEKEMARQPLDEACAWIQAHLSPEDVFERCDLDVWAGANDYVKKKG